MRKVSLLWISMCMCMPTVSLADNGNSKLMGTHVAKHHVHKVKHANKNPQPRVTSTYEKSNNTTPNLVLNKLNEITISGYVEGSYNYLYRSNQFLSGVDDRVYDIEPNGLTVHQAAITFLKAPTDGFGGLLNLIAGRDASKIAAYGFKPETVGADLTQAYLEYQKKSFDFIFGKFITIGGIEEINPTLDDNFSRSILFGYATPNTLLGLRTTYTMNDKLKLIAGLNNGWDNIRDTKRRKTIELGTTYTISPTFAFLADIYNGEERATPFTDVGPLGVRSLLDLVAIYNATEKWSFIGNYDFAEQSNAALPNGTFGKARWQGIAGYANYKFNDLWKGSIRGEFFNDKDGYRTGIAQSWKEITLTLGYSPLKNLNLRAEFRHDFSNVSSFKKSYAGTASSNQQSYALEGTYVI